MIISDYAIKHKTTILVVIVIIIVAGMWAYVSLPRESAPDIEFPYIMVSANYEGASPSDMESLVTFPIERKLKNLTDVKQMSSVSAEGMSQIFLEFEPDVNIDTALQKVRDKVNESKQDLPGDLDDPMVKEIATSEVFPLMFINISGNVGLVRLKKIAEDMEDDIEAIAGVLDAEIIGGLEREIRVEFDQERLSAYGLTMSEIVQTVTQNNLNTPGGGIDIGEAKYSLKVPAEFSSPDEIYNLVVSMRGGKPVYLSDLAVAKDTFKDRTSFSRMNGREAITLKVTKRSGENVVRIADAIRGVISEYERRLPDGINFNITSDESKMVHLLVMDLENNIISGLILVLAVIFISLGFRNAILVSFAIPLSMLITFFVLQAMGVTLNMIVLFSLVLALGMLVDNGIVIVENIYRHHTEEKKPLIQAAMEGTSEVAWPVISSTATTVVAFAPLMFWPGIMGEFMGYLPRTVIIALSASLFVALVITPVLSALLIKAHKKSPIHTGAESREGFIIRAYRGFIEYALCYRLLTVMFFFFLLVIMIMAYAGSGLGVEFFPDTEPNKIMVKIEAPQGTNIYQTNNLSLQAEALISHYGNIENITASISGNTADISIDMVDREFRRDTGDDDKISFRDSNKTLEAIRTELASAIVGAVVTVEKEKNGPPVGAPVNVEIGGNDYTTLASIASRLQDEIRDIPGLVDLTDDYKPGLPEVNIIVDKERAAIMGLDAMLIGQMIKVSVNGVKIGDYREGEDEYDITARLPIEQRRNLQDVLRLRVPSPTGQQIPLTSVAKMETGSGLSSIKHINKKRIVTVGANVAKGFNSPQVLAEVRQVAEKGRVRILPRDIKDQARFLALIRDGGDDTAKLIQKHLKPATLQKLTGSVLAEDDQGDTLNQVLSDLNLALARRNGLDREALSSALPDLVAPAGEPIPLPQGYTISYTGENEEQEKAQAYISKAFVMAILLIAFVLVTQFNSVLTPIIIMTSVILSLIGVFLGLMVTNHSFGIIMTGMGVISLAGVVVNNAIVLIDYTNLLRRQGMACREAIVTACCTRFRPVLLTAVTTMLGMIPMAIGISYNFHAMRWEVASEMSQYWGSMASAVIFGLAVATALTLFVVPNIYSLIFERRRAAVPE